MTSILQAQALWVAVGTGMLPLASVVLGIWFRHGPAWTWVIRRFAFKISDNKDELRDLPMGRSVLRIDLRPRFTAMSLSGFSIRFVACKTLWKQAVPVSSSCVHIVGLEWKPRVVHDHISVSQRPDDYGGGFEGIFCEGEPEFPTDAELALEITVEASRCWSGYLSFEGWLPGRELTAYGRVRASVGGFSAREVLSACFSNHARRFLSKVPGVRAPPNLHGRESRRRSRAGRRNGAGGDG